MKILHSRSSWAKLGLVVLYLLSRTYILWDAPRDFSEIIYSYMPYAHLWASGVRPYLDQWYEYPPATIPLFYLPHLFDMASLHQPWHLSYMLSYRGLMLLVDLATFVMLWSWLRAYRVSFGRLSAAMIFYILATAKAHHFIYDTMDAAFVAAILLGIVAPVWRKQESLLIKIIAWVGYFLAVALKYINAPLGLAIAVAQPLNKWRSTLIAIAIGGLLVWGLPLGLYRSSLQVSLQYQQIRGLQVDSTGAVIARTISEKITHSETVIEVYKNYELSGPVTQVTLRIADGVFKLAIGGYAVWAAWWAWRNQSKWRTPLQRQLAVLWLTWGYLILFLLTGKVLSRPFLLWLIPLAAALSVAGRVKFALRYQVVVLVLVVTFLSALPKIHTDWLLSLPLLVGWVRVVGLCLMAYWFVRDTEKISEGKV